MGGVCPECGFVHPPVQPGSCPAAKHKKMMETNNGREIVNFISRLTTHLEKMDDPRPTINSLKLTLKW